MRLKWRFLVDDTRGAAERLRLLLAADGLLCFTLFVFAPVYIYVNNTNEFWFRLSQFWWMTALLGLAVFAVLVGVGCILRGRLLDMYVTALFAFAVVVYLQGSFLNISYGELNGQQVNWSRYGGYAIQNTMLVGALFLVPFVIRYFSKRFWEKMVRVVALFIVAVQCVAMVTVGVANRKPPRTEMALGWEGVHAYSPDRNLVLLVVDAFDDVYFDEWLSASPAQADALDGFTRYTNTAGISMTTFYSMVPMLTGHVFTYNPPDLNDYLDEAWADASMFRKLQAADYDVRVLGPQEIYLGRVRDDVIDNYIVGNRGIMDPVQFTRQMMELSLYTFLPHVLKAGFWIYPDEFNYLQDKVFYTDDDTEALRHMTDEPVDASAKQPTFRLYHLNALHEPFTLTSDATRSDTDTSALAQAQGTMRIVEKLLLQMQEAGVYDNTAIVITADHGNGTHVESDNLKSQPAMPVLLYKPMGGARALTESAAPASLMDIRATLLSAAGLDAAGEGTPLELLKEGQNRERLFYRSVGSPRVFYEYSIDGDARQYENWRQTGNVYSPPTDAAAQSPDGE